MRMPSATSGGEYEGGACNIYGAGAMPVVSQLRESLVETARLLRAFEQERQTSEEVASLDMYQKCCRQFVTYLVANMDTSPGFSQQMEPIIEASYSNSSVVDSELWLRCRTQEEIEREGGGELYTPSRQDMRIKTDTSVTVTPLAIVSASVTGVRPTCSPHVDMTLSTPSTVGRAAKRPKRTTSEPSKRPRHTVSRNLYGSGSLSEESETETETEAEAGQESANRVAPVTQHNNDSESFVWPCSGYGAVERSEAFKMHMKTALELVDAENCTPLSGMLCTHGCDRLRDLMCKTHREQGGRAMPCHDGTCLVWRVVDKHLVRCQDSQCEFKNRVGLRQTLHDIQQEKMKLEDTSQKLEAAKATLARGGSQSVISQLESRIERLEGKCSKLGDAVGFHKEREHTFWTDLMATGVHRGTDRTDGLPSVESHYARQ